MVGRLRASKTFLGLIIILENFLAVFPRLVGLHLVLPLHELVFIEDVAVVHLLISNKRHE